MLGSDGAMAIAPIDLVAVNLYPFEQTISREGVKVSEAIEQIDIGGPSMLRAAAKNHRDVLPLPDPSLYPEFLRQFEKGEISDEFRRACAVAVFERTSEYDRTIASYLATGASWAQASWAEASWAEASWSSASWAEASWNEASWSSNVDSMMGSTASFSESTFSP